MKFIVQLFMKHLNIKLHFDTLVLNEMESI